MGQQPPPKLAGQDLKPVLQVRVPRDVLLVVVRVLLSEVAELEDSVLAAVVSSLLVVEPALEMDVVVRTVVVGVGAGRVVVLVTVLLTMPGASQWSSAECSFEPDNTYSQHLGR